MQAYLDASRAHLSEGFLKDLRTCQRRVRQDLTKTLKDSYGYRREKGNRYVWNALDGKWITKTNAKAAPIFPLSVYRANNNYHRRWS